jgi:hypothetical protein
VYCCAVFIGLTVVAGLINAHERKSETAQVFVRGIKAQVYKTIINNGRRKEDSIHVLVSCNDRYRECSRAMPVIFQSNMVLQRDKVVTIWALPMREKKFK